VDCLRAPMRLDKLWGDHRDRERIVRDGAGTPALIRAVGSGGRRLGPEGAVAEGVRVGAIPFVKAERKPLAHRGTSGTRALAEWVRRGVPRVPSRVRREIMTGA
jgi:hypothetical protein